MGWRRHPHQRRLRGGLTVARALQHTREEKREVRFACGLTPLSANESSPTSTLSTLSHGSFSPFLQHCKSYTHSLPFVSLSFHLFSLSLCYSVPPRIVVKSHAIQILTYPHALEMATPRTPTTKTLSSYPYHMDFLTRRRDPSTCCCPQRQWTKGAPFDAPTQSIITFFRHVKSIYSKGFFNFTIFLISHSK